MLRWLLAFFTVASLVGGGACREGATRSAEQASSQGQGDPASIAAAAIEHAGLPPGFAYLYTGPLVQDGSPRGALVTYTNPRGETFSVGVSMEASASEAKAQYDEFVFFLDGFTRGKPVVFDEQFSQPPAAVREIRYDHLELRVDDVTTSAYVLRDQQETPDEALALSNIIVAFMSGNVWGQVEAYYRQGSGLEEAAVDCIKRAIRAALAAAGG